MADDSFLSHPEILPEEKLIEVLCSRGLPKNELMEKDKAFLVELFYRFVVPRPQRPINMRRSNRLRKSLNPVSNIQSTNAKTNGQNRGLKRKQAFPGMDEAIKGTNLSNFLHRPSKDCPTIECAERIINLTMNSVSKTPVKPIKLSRNCLTKDCQTKMNSDPSHADTIINSMKSNSGTVSSKESGQKQESTSSDSQVDSEEDSLKTCKKFKRITVTWP